MAKIIIYGDGACSGNPGPGGWAFLLVDIAGNLVIEKSGPSNPTTNNRMELTALKEALKTLLELYPHELEVELYWDSSYVVNGYNQWLHNWARRDFTKADGAEISNLELWQEVWQLKQKLPKFKMTQIPGHSSLPGNERVDELAVSQSKDLDIMPYSGSLDHYLISLEDLFIETTKGTQKYPAYLSLIDGKLSRYLTWDECKSQVQGKSAKYKKVKNAVEESQTLKAWKL
jgi:ribonuclease HI